MDQDLLTTSLSPSRKTLFQTVLSDQHPKLGLDSSSKVLATSIEVAETLSQWLSDGFLDMPRSCIVLTSSKDLDIKLQKAANLIPVTKVQDESVTHAFSHIASWRRNEVLMILKEIFYALVPKGVCIVTVTKRNPVEEIVLSTLRATGRRGSVGGTKEILSNESELKNLAEQAQFELGKIRVSVKDVMVKGIELGKLKAQVQMMLDGILGQIGDGHSWERVFDSAWDAEVERNGGELVIEAYVLVAMKWDLLCA